MSKGEQTRSAILRAAMAQFAQKGYAAVTMSDLCASTGLSRGGLYRHFSSTAQVFLSMLAADKDYWQLEMRKGMEDGKTASQMLGYYLNRMRDGIARGDGRLALAAYEFLRDEECPPDFARRRFEEAVRMLEQLLRYGVERGEFRPCDVTALAVRDIVLIDGLRLANATGVLSLEGVTQQIDSIRDSISNPGIAGKEEMK